MADETQAAVEEQETTETGETQPAGGEATSEPQAEETATDAGGASPAPSVAEDVEDQAKKIVETLETEIGNARAALAHLKTSSNAEHGGTIVNVAITKFEKSISSLEDVLALIKKLSGK